VIQLHRAPRPDAIRTWAERQGPPWKPSKKGRGRFSGYTRHILLNPGLKRTGRDIKAGRKNFVGFPGDWSKRQAGWLRASKRDARTVP